MEEENTLYQLVGRSNDPLAVLDSDDESRYEYQPQYGYAFGTCPEGCDQCDTPFFKRKYAYGSKECLHCGVWCKNCLNPKWAWEKYNTQEMKGPELEQFKKECAERMMNTPWGIIKKEVIVDEKIEIREEDADTCPDCETIMITEVGEIIMSQLQVESLVDIVHSYIDWREHSVVLYNWPLQRVPVTCKVCGETRARQRRFVEENGSVVICSTCQKHELDNIEHVNQVVRHRQRFTTHALRTCTPLAFDNPDLTKNLDIIQLIVLYQDSTKEELCDEFPALLPRPQ